MSHCFGVTGKFLLICSDYFFWHNSWFVKLRTKECINFEWCNNRTPFIQGLGFKFFPDLILLAIGWKPNKGWVYQVHKNKKRLKYNDFKRLRKQNV